jgi:hypothetical protein
LKEFKIPDLQKFLLPSCMPACFSCEHDCDLAAVGSSQHTYTILQNTVNIHEITTIFSPIIGAGSTNHNHYTKRIGVQNSERSHTAPTQEKSCCGN